MQQQQPPQKLELPNREISIIRRLSSFFSKDTHPHISLSYHGHVVGPVPDGQAGGTGDAVHFDDVNHLVDDSNDAVKRVCEYGALRGCVRSERDGSIKRSDSMKRGSGMEWLVTSCFCMGVSRHAITDRQDCPIFSNCFLCCLLVT